MTYQEIMQTDLEPMQKIHAAANRANEILKSCQTKREAMALIRDEFPSVLADGIVYFGNYIRLKD